MWRSVAGRKASVIESESDDDWETEADYENQADDKSQLKEARTHNAADQRQVAAQVRNEDAKVD